MNKIMRVFCSLAGIGLMISVCIGAEQGSSTEFTRKPWIDSVQDRDEEPRRPATPRAILAATGELQKAVNGKALVHNHCRTQGKEIDIEETAEVVERERCKIVVRTTKTTRLNASPKKPSDSQAIEFMIYADLSDLTTPVLTENQRFAQCDAGLFDVLRVSSRTDPKQLIRVVRRSLTTKDEGSKQTRKDLSLFFADAKAAKRAADALDRAVKACGGKEWPDEDDLP